MPWHIEDNNADCEGFAVVKDDTDEIIGCHLTNADAAKHLAALYIAEEELIDGAEDQLESEDPMMMASRWISTAPVSLEVRESGSSPEEIVVRGHAAVFNNLSHDLGGFREQIAPGAFSDVLAAQPDVHLVVGHDMTMPLARTANGTLELREDEQGLYMWARINSQLSYAKDLAEQLRTGLVDQMSFAFTTAEDGDQWVKDEQTGEVMRTVRKVAGLYDVSVVAQGAYPQTDVGLIRSALRKHNLLDSSQDIPGALTVAPDTQAGGAVASDEGSEQTKSKRLQVMRAKSRLALHTHHSKEK